MQAEKKQSERLIYGQLPEDVTAILLADGWRAGILRLYSREVREYESGGVQTWTEHWFEFADMIAGPLDSILAVRIG